MKKLSLDLDTLAVDSFDTGESISLNGTVQANESGDQPTPTPPEHPCTCFNTCLCRTNYYYCGTGPDTIYSCDYTHNGSCITPA